MTVTGGNYGWKIDQKAEIKVLKKNIKNQQQVTRKPEYSQKELYTDNHGLGGYLHRSQSDGTASVLL